MAFRTITADLLDTCAKRKSCKGCPYRVGCFTRYTFYVKTEAEYDAFLKKNIETDSNPVSIEVANGLRQKYKDERSTYPKYSEV